MHPSMHTYRDRDRCPQTDMQTETYLEIHTETEVHRESETDRHRYTYIYRDTDRERAIAAQIDAEMTERDW